MKMHHFPPYTCYTPIIRTKNQLKKESGTRGVVLLKNCLRWYSIRGYYNRIGMILDEKTNHGY
jgi:hypothetical protein